MEEQNLKLGKQLRHELQQHPELSNQETWTKEHLIDFLKSNTKLEIVDKGLWFYAIYWAGKERSILQYIPSSMISRMKSLKPRWSYLRD